ncbi:MAG: class I SAM-dependent methyltransferase [Kiritimatiellaeota bacterium]|nr:class I SAM-dependent methyltransferase [Kiritimatiellota bacterium]
MTTPQDASTRQTAELFGDLWHRYDDRLFEASVQLFYDRFRANGFDLGSLRGQRCIDVGCGGGRLSIAMARLGAAEVIGCDISEEGLRDARRRATGLTNVRFERASTLELPYPDASFDFVLCNGVLHHTPDPLRGFGEITRVLKRGGRCFVLLYGKGGLRWPTVMKIRPHAQAMGYALVDEAIRLAALPANKQRTFLDDFFVPHITFYDGDEIHDLFALHGYRDMQRWTTGKLDHESSVAVQGEELGQMAAVFDAALAPSAPPHFAAARAHAGTARDETRAALADLRAVEAEFAAGRIDERERDWRVHGWGHHRVLATRI